MQNRSDLGKVGGHEDLIDSAPHGLRELCKVPVTNREALPLIVEPLHMAVQESNVHRATIVIAAPPTRSRRIHIGVEKHRPGRHADLVASEIIHALPSRLLEVTVKVRAEPLLGSSDLGDIRLRIGEIIGRAIQMNRIEQTLLDEQSVGRIGPQGTGIVIDHRVLRPRRGRVEQERGIGSCREPVPVVASISMDGDRDLPEVACAHGELGVGPGLGERGEQERNQQSDDRNHDQEFDERECPAALLHGYP